MTAVCYAVAIDGPVAAGKTTVGERLAQRLGAYAFDTGLLYRAVAHRVTQADVDPADCKQVAAIARETTLTLLPPSVDDGRAHDVLVNGEDVTWRLRSPEIDRALPSIAANPDVRAALMAEQRRVGLSGQVVVIGRDIGTVILPDAEFKFFLDAPMEERAWRRYQELRERGVDVSLDQVIIDLEKRDQADQSRAVAPLRAAPDAQCIQTGGLTVDEVTQRIFDLVHRGLAAGRGREC